MSDEATAAPDPVADPGPVTVEHKGFSVTSNHSPTIKALKDGLSAGDAAKEPPPEEGESAPVDESEEVSEAAAKLGAKGGEAAAKKRKEAAKEDAKEPDEGEEAKKKAAEEIEAAPKEAKKKLASERVGEATRDAAQAKRELAAERARNEDLARRLNDLERRVAPPQPPPEQKPAANGENAPPRPEDFEGNEAGYLDALVAHRVQGALRTADQQRYEASIKARRGQVIHKLNTEFRQRADKLRETDPEIDTKVADYIKEIDPHYAMPAGQEPGPENFLVSEVIKSKHGPELAVYLSENPDEFRRIATAQDPWEITREVAKLEVRLGAPAGTPPPERTVSKASPPVRPVTGTPFVAEPEGYRPGMTLDEYAKVWRKQHRAR